MTKFFKYIFLIVFLILYSCNSEVETGIADETLSLKSIPFHPIKELRFQKDIYIINPASFEIPQFRYIEEPLPLMNFQHTPLINNNSISSAINLFYRSTYLDKSELGKMKLSDKLLMSLNFDNDIFNNSDRYYTNGINIALVSPKMERLPLMKTLYYQKHNSLNYFGLKLVQNIYTADNPKLDYLNEGDRPFSSYLYLGHYRISINKVKEKKIMSSFNLGVIGPAGLGEFIQRSLHRTEPKGWKFQIKNDIVIDYQLEVDKGLYHKRNFELNGIFNGRIGSLYDKAGFGLLLRYGKFHPYYSGLITNENLNPRQEVNSFLQYFTYFKIENQFIGYDATLQGGLFTRDNIYVLTPSTINRSIIRASLGIVFSNRFLQIEIVQYYLSPEFENGKHHLWWHINTALLL